MVCRKMLGFILVLTLLLTAMQISVAENVQGPEILTQLMEMEETCYMDQLADSDQLAEGFIRNVMLSKPSLVSRSSSTAGSRLTGTVAKLYDLLKTHIVEIANGNKSSTTISYTMEEAYAKTQFTFAELGVTTAFDDNGQLTQEAQDAIVSQIQIDTGALNQALSLDCPYELYWYDKTNGINVGYNYSLSFGSGYTSFSFSGTIEISFFVAAEYAVNGEAGTFEYNTAFGQNAKAAAEKAKQIVNKYASSTDREKLVGYGKEICGLTSYNTPASQGGFQYGNPWQLIWVFDGDPETKVVCEGYSKAFQYLCELTQFSGNISVISVSGVMAGGTGAGNHMWNVVRLDNGKRYLVDVTNIDEGTIGYPDQLMLAGYTSGNYADGYIFATAGGDISYVYNAETKNSFSVEALTIAGKDDSVSYEGLTCISVPDNTKQIESEAFAGTDSEVIIIPAACEEIAGDAFDNCAQLKYIVNRSNVEITAPAGVTVLIERDE